MIRTFKLSSVFLTLAVLSTVLLPLLIRHPLWGPAIGLGLTLVLAIAGAILWKWHGVIIPAGMMLEHKLKKMAQEVTIGITLKWFRRDLPWFITQAKSWSITNHHSGPLWVATVVFTASTPAALHQLYKKGGPDEVEAWLWKQVNLFHCNPHIQNLHRGAQVVCELNDYLLGVLMASDLDCLGFDVRTDSVVINPICCTGGRTRG